MGRRKMRRPETVSELIGKIKSSSEAPCKVMEVCGTHTKAIAESGIADLVKPAIHLVSGPGCPVCVTSKNYIDIAIQLLKMPQIIIATFGDMMKVTGNGGSLMSKSEYRNRIAILYSPLDALTLAKKYKEKEIVFLAVGFETTAPIIALMIKTAKEHNICNLSVLSGLKRMEPVLHKILSEKNINIRGILCPGHVAAVMGANYFSFITHQYHIPAVVAGFEPYDIIMALYDLFKQQEMGTPHFKNLYRSVVSDQGNQKAIEMMEEVFEEDEARWRGIGVIANSGMAIREEYQQFDVYHRFTIQEVDNSEKDACICSQILLGKKLPVECIYFGKGCTPDTPIGPCMVSYEGACSINYQWRDGQDE